MFDSLKQLFSQLVSEPDNPDLLNGMDDKLAVAALMFHVIAVDGVVEQSERDRFRAVMAERYDLDDEQTAQLLKDAKEADRQAIDLYRFTSLLMRTLGPEERLSLVRNLWEMVYADGEVHEMEDNLVWRIADLLGIDQHERGVLKREVRSSG